MTMAIAAVAANIRTDHTVTRMDTVGATVTMGIIVEITDILAVTMVAEIIAAKI